jgi:hypothetical protein
LTKRSVVEAKTHRREHTPQAQSRKSPALYFEDANGDPLYWAASGERVHADVRFLATHQTARSTDLIAGFCAAVDDAEYADFGARRGHNAPSSSKIQRSSDVDLTVVSGYFDALILITTVILIAVGIAVDRITGQ